MLKKLRKVRLLVVFVLFSSQSATAESSKLQLNLFDRQILFSQKNNYTHISQLEESQLECKPKFMKLVFDSHWYASIEFNEEMKNMILDDSILKIDALSFDLRVPFNRSCEIPEWKSIQSFIKSTDDIQIVVNEEFQIVDITYPEDKRSTHCHTRLDVLRSGDILVGDDKNSSAIGSFGGSVVGIDYLNIAKPCADLELDDVKELTAILK